MTRLDQDRLLTWRYLSDTSLFGKCLMINLDRVRKTQSWRFRGGTVLWPAVRRCNQHSVRPGSLCLDSKRGQNLPSDTVSGEPPETTPWLRYFAASSGDFKEDPRRCPEERLQHNNTTQHNVLKKVKQHEDCIKIWYLTLNFFSTYLNLYFL